MGQLGREIIRDVDVKEVIKELKAAYADEVKDEEHTENLIGE